jgi:hypothetical protein
LKRWGQALSGTRRSIATLVETSAAQDAVLSLILTVARTHTEFALEHMILPLLVCTI